MVKILKGDNMSNNDGIRPSEDSSFYYKILDVGGVTNDVNSIKEHFFDPNRGFTDGRDIDPGFFLEPADPGSYNFNIDIDGDGVEEEVRFAEFEDSGFYLDPNKDAREAAQEHNSGEFQKAAQFAQENGLTAVLVEVDPGMLAVSLHTKPEVIYLDNEGNRVQPDNAPGLDFHHSDGQGDLFADLDLGGLEGAVYPDQTEPAEPLSPWDRFALGVPDIGIQTLPNDFSQPDAGYQTLPHDLSRDPVGIELLALLNNPDEPVQTWDNAGPLQLSLNDMGWGDAVITDGFSSLSTGDNASLRSVEAEQAMALQSSPLDSTFVEPATKVNL